MPAILRTSRRVHIRIAAVLTAIAAIVGVQAATQAPAANAMVTTASVRALHIAPLYRGVPYVWGGTTPRGFDCSGYTKYVYARAGVWIPRTAQQQYNYVHHVGKHIRPGDLVFYYNPRTHGVYHVAIYAGGSYVWHSPHPGAGVRLERNWSKYWVGGRA